MTSPRAGSRRGMPRRAAWSGLDQALASGTNVVLGVVVARSVSLEEFGAFSAVYLTYVLIGLLSRAACSEVLVVRYSAVHPSDQRRGIKASLGTALITGIVSALGCVVVWSLTDGVLASGFLALAACMPALLIQDAWRFAFFTQHRPAAATANDLLWAVSQFGVLALVAVVGDISAVSAILAWGAGAYVCSVAGAFQAGTAPAPGAAGWWWHSHRDLMPRFVAEYAIGRGSGQLTFFLVASVTSLAAFGALRAGNLLLGPLNVLFATAAIVAIPEGVRLRRQTPVRLWNLCIGAGIVMVVAAGVVGASLLVLPDSAGTAILGDSWEAARPVLLPLTFAAGGLAAQMAALIGLRAMALARHSLLARATVAPVRLAAATAGGALAGATGAAWGLALSEVVGGLVHWRQLVAGYREERESAAAAAETDAAERKVGLPTDGAVLPRNHDLPERTLGATPVVSPREGTLEAPW